MNIQELQSSPEIAQDQLLEESFEALRSDNCPTRLAVLIEKVRMVIEIGVGGNMVLVWQNRIADLQKRHAESNSPWNEHKKSCQVCIQAGNNFGAP